MNRIEDLERDHEEIRLRILELEQFMEDLPISIPEINLKLSKIGEFWNKHEKKEERLFKQLEINDIKFPVKKMDTAHRQIRGHLQVLREMIRTNNADKIMVALETDGKMFVEKLMKHMDFEESLFTIIPVSQLRFLAF